QRQLAQVGRVGRRRDDLEALPGAVRVAVGEQAGRVAEPERRVVAGGLDRGQEVERRAQRGGEVGQLVDAAADARVDREARARAEYALEGLGGRDRPWHSTQC